MAIIIRDATPMDADNIVELIKEWAIEVQAHSPITASYVSQYLASPSDYLLIAEWDQQFAGFVAYSIRLDLWHAAPCCYIEDVVVKPSFRGHGIGTELLKYMLEMAKKEGYVEISLTVSKDNIKAQELYKRIGIDEEVLCFEKHIK